MDQTHGKRRIGIAGVDKVAWGEHVCVFFDTKEELLNLCVPFIKAGLEDNEFCMWITGEPVNELRAFEALQEVSPNAHHFLADKQLEILPYKQWYLRSGIFDAQIVLDNWVSKARYVEARGFDGIRITGTLYGSSPRKIGPNLAPTNKPSIRPFAMSGLLPCVRIR